MELDPKYDDYDYPTTAPDGRPGHPGHTTPEQNALVHVLRSKLEAAGYTDRLDTLTLVRILLPCIPLLRYLWLMPILASIPPRPEV